MVNRELSNRFSPKDKEIGETIIKLKNLSSVYNPKLQEISLDVRAGEILGIGGLVGVGRTELFECIFSLRMVAEGDIYLEGKEFLKSQKNAKSARISMVIEEHSATSIFLMMDIR